MKVSLESIPIILDGSFIYYNEQEDGGIIFTPKKHPEVKTLKANKVTKYILEKCNGENNLNEILEYMDKAFKGSTLEAMKEDMFNILFPLWRIGIIYWKTENPYKYFYEKEEGKYKYKILTQDESIEEINKLKKADELRYDYRVNKSYSLNVNRIFQSVFGGIEQYSAIYNNDEVEMLICLKYEHDHRQSLNILILYEKESSNLKKENILELIIWSKTQYASFLNKVFTGVIYIAPNNDERVNKILEMLKFDYFGTLRDCILLDGEYVSLDVKGMEC